MSNDHESSSSPLQPGTPVNPQMIPGVRAPADLSVFVRDRTVAVERGVRQRRMTLLILCLVGVFSIAVALLLTGLLEQAEHRVSPRRIGMYGLNDAARFVASPLEMRRETERTDLRVAMRLARADGPRPLLARKVLSFLEARGEDGPHEAVDPE